MIPAPDRTNGLKPTRGFLIALIVSLVLWAVIIGLLFLLFSKEPDTRPVQTLPAWQEKKIERYMKERKIRPQVVFIRWDDRLFYDLNGRKAEIK